MPKISDRNPVVEAAAQKALKDFELSADAEKAKAAARMGNRQLATMRILYHMPDYPKFLQEFVHSIYDDAPNYPMARKFVRWWNKNLDGKVHTAYVAGHDLKTGRRLAHADVVIQ